MLKGAFGIYHDLQEYRNIIFQLFGESDIENKEYLSFEEY